MPGYVKKVGMANVLSFPMPVSLFIRPDLDPSQANYYPGSYALRQEAGMKMEVASSLLGILTPFETSQEIRPFYAPDR